MRWLLVQIDDNDEAAAYKDSLSAGNAFITVQVRRPDGELADSGEYKVAQIQPKVVAEWAVPTKFCDCGPEVLKTPVRGEKFGWYVCKKCKKTLPNRTHSFKNLLDPPGLDVTKMQFLLSARVRNDGQ